MSFYWWNYLLLEMISNVTVSMYVSLYLCVCVCVPTSRGCCIDSLRLHSSVCIWSEPNEAESLAVVRHICRAREWWASHFAAAPRRSAHIWGPCLLFAQWLGTPVYPCHRRSCHICCGCHLEGPLDCHCSFSCHPALTGSKSGWPNACFGKILLTILFLFFKINLFTCIPSYAIQCEYSSGSVISATVITA